MSLRAARNLATAGSRRTGHRVLGPATVGSNSQPMERLRRIAEAGTDSRDVVRDVVEGQCPGRLFRFGFHCCHFASRSAKFPWSANRCARWRRTCKRAGILGVSLLYERLGFLDHVLCEVEVDVRGAVKLCVGIRCFRPCRRYIIPPSPITVATALRRTVLQFLGHFERTPCLTSIPAATF